MKNIHFSDIVTERLTLRQIDERDAESIYRNFANERVSEYPVDCEPYENASEALELINWYTRPEPRDRHRWVIERKSGNAFPGTCGFHCIDFDNNICELGYDLSPEYWSNGYMTEALGAILAFIFESTEINRVQAFVHTENARSCRLLERNGFSREGIFRDKHLFRGKYYDHFMYSLLRREYLRAD